MVPEGPQVQHLHTHGAKHHNQPHGKHTLSHHPETVALFHDVANSIQDAKEILLCGPGEAKIQFNQYLQKHFAHSIAKSVVATETVDHPTDKQILDFARKFFKSYDLFKS
jgi:stalled ribosome rescue protein Dom34